MLEIWNWHMVLISSCFLRIAKNEYILIHLRNIQVKPTPECRMNISLLARVWYNNNNNKIFTSKQRVKELSAKSLSQRNRVKEKMFAYSHKGIAVTVCQKKTKMKLKRFCGYKFSFFFFNGKASVYGLGPLSIFAASLCTVEIHFLRNNEIFVFGPAIISSVFRISLWEWQSAASIAFN